MLYLYFLDLPPPLCCFSTLNRVCFRSQPSRKSHGKVPKRAHKAEREKMKREHLNDLFLSLASVLELSDETNGKASILNEASRIMKDMLAQVESLRKENEALLSESQYVDVEKKELQDDTASLASQIAELQKELKDRASEAVLDLNTAPPECQRHGLTPHPYPAIELAMQQADNLKSVYVFPMCTDPTIFPTSGNLEMMPRPLTTVSKPQPRYPTPADKWPSQLLENHHQYLG
ncbi:OLC1v1012611C2 [Oldenlandia corymbosa var. corymbosa]|uniref:OLC1v1012611C2 n=1 Tax=Oldenlandia corymbosa var. corymbosa TaxID=529605 RepID=A0AAV1DZA9_OLDCO|nr:OLC1v1012611C2 [Oldenlandia corymbosa var. corymbosa]